MSNYDLDYFTSVDTCPLDEDTVQVSDGDYFPAMNREAIRYADMLRNRFVGFDLVRFKRTRNAHDFGTYEDIELWYYPESDTSLAQAQFIESHLPRIWDDDEVFEWNLVKAMAEA